MCYITRMRVEGQRRRHGMITEKGEWNGGRFGGQTLPDMCSMFLLDYGLYVKDHLDDTLNTTPTLYGHGFGIDNPSHANPSTHCDFNGLSLFRTLLAILAYVLRVALS